MKRIYMAATAALSAAVLVSASLAQEGQRGRPPAPKPKNLKVLKDLPPGQLIPVMRSWNDALGVKCDFCHVINADHTGFERDDKPAKNMAREMVRLTRRINMNKVVRGKVSCFTCHHGRPEPERPGRGGQGEQGEKHEKGE